MLRQDMQVPMEAIIQFLVELTWLHSRLEEDLLQAQVGNILVNIGLSARRDSEFVSGKKKVMGTHLVLQDIGKLMLWFRVSSKDANLTQILNGYK
jgi:hypothetical protein